MRVDPDAAEVQLARDPGGAPEVVRPDRRRQPVRHAVRERHRLRLVHKGLDGDDRAEDLLLHDLVVLAKARDHGGGEEEPRPAVRCAAGLDAGVRGYPVDEAAYALELGGAVQRAEVDARRLCRGGFGQLRDELVVNRRLDEHAAARGAVLPGVVERRTHDALRRFGEVDIVEDQQGGVAAEFEVGALEVGGGDGRDVDARARGPGDRDQFGDRVPHQRPAGLAVAAQDVERARREEFGRNPSQQHRGGRRCLGGLQHDGVARGQRRGDLPDGHHQGVVPRRDLRADPDRLSADHRRVAGRVLPGRGAFQVPRRPGEEPQRADALRDFLAQHDRPDLAGLAYLEVGELLRARLEGVGDLQQRDLAL